MVTKTFQPCIAKTLQEMRHLRLAALQFMLDSEQEPIQKPWPVREQSGFMRRFVCSVAEFTGPKIQHSMGVAHNGSPFVHQVMDTGFILPGFDDVHFMIGTADTDSRSQRLDLIA